MFWAGLLAGFILTSIVSGICFVGLLMDIRPKIKKERMRNRLALGIMTDRGRGYPGWGQ